MALTPLRAMIRKDLLLFFSDRRSVIVSFIVPIAIASFFGAIFSGSSGDREPAKIDVAMIDLDGSPISKGIVAGAQGDKNLRVSLPSEAEARESVRGGKLAAAVVIPKGFGEAAGSAFFGDGEKPQLNVMFDPSRSMERAMINGVMTQHVMEAVTREMFGGAQGRQTLTKALPAIQSSTTMPADQKRALVDMLNSVQQYYDRTPSNGAQADSGPRGITMPYTVHEEPITAGAVAYNGYAHSFGGMAVQFLLFAMANMGVEMLLERQKGLWKRLRSAPVSRLSLLTGKMASGAIISLMILLVCFAFAIVVFKVRVQGSVVGFLAVCVACSLMASTFGVLVAALGNTPATARGVTTLAVLMMVMLGGAWVPAFVFPAWLQQFTLVVPVRWAVDGMDAMTWRGIGLTGAVAPTLILLGFAVLFGTIATMRFRWEEA
jgi:ABC-2 type transport system permease protein